MRKITFGLSALALAMLLWSCDNTGKNSASTTAMGNFKFIDKSNMDTTIHPGDDFFEYANGAWLKNTKMPDDKSRWGSFDELRLRTDSALYNLLNELKPNANNLGESNVANFYKSGMDSAAVNALGVKAIEPLLTAINNISTTEDLINVIASNQRKGLRYVFGLYIGPDDKNVNKIITQFSQTGLGLPNKDYYTDKDEKSVKNRAAYLDYIKQILMINGQDEATATANATKIFNIENSLATASLRPQEMRNPDKLYNKFHIDAFSKKTANIDWRNLLDKLGIKGEDSMIVTVPSYYIKLSDMLKSVPVDDWKQYLTFHTINDMAAYLGDNIDQANFNFYGKILRGQPAQEPRWKRVTATINASIGEELGKLYVNKHFKPEAKEKMNELVGNLQKAFAERIEGLDWMSSTTKAKAMAKLNSFVSKIGYPNKWRDYSKLAITPDNYAMNVLNAMAFAQEYEINKLGKPVDREEWFMTPNTVNAYYNPAFNEIVFPAGILQFPFFDFNADDAINYGGIGAVIGHELSHGFDDQGAKYAADGNLSNWWTDEDMKKFKEKTQILVNQYNNFVVIDTLTVNGELTLGENIADLGGVAIAYQAFKKTKQGQSNELIDGYTPDQRFFLSWAQIWRGVARDEMAIQLLKTDPHSPSKARANLPLANFDPFYEAFDVKEGHKMYIAPEQRARIW